jgi:hypothetical protein
MARRSKITGTPKTNLVVPAIGTSGLRQYGGYVREEPLRELQGPRGIAAYQEMGANSAVIGSGLAFGRLLASMVKWEVEAYSQEAEDKARAEFFQSCMDDMSHPWEDVVASAFGMLQFGFAPHEIVLKVREGGDTSKHDDGLIGWARLPLRSQDSLKRWEFDANGNWTAMVQQVQTDTKERRIPRAKLLNFRTRTEKDNPEGVSALRHVYWTYYWWKRMQETEGIGVERSLSGFPVIRVPAEVINQGGAAFDSWKQAGQNVRTDSDSCIIIPSDYIDGHEMYSFKLESSSSPGLPDTSAIIERLDRRMAQALGTDFMLLGHEGVGSYALGDNKTATHELAVEGHVEHVAKPFRQELFPLTMRLNGWPVERTPRLKHCPLEKADLARLGDFLSKLVQVNILTADENLETHVREQANLPVRDPASPKRERPSATQTKPEGGAPDAGKPPESKPTGPNGEAAAA